MNKTDKIKKRLQIVMYVLIILSILRSFIARASAADMPSWAEDYLDDYFSEHFNSSYRSYFEQAKQDCSYFCIWEYDNSYFIDFYPLERMGFYATQGSNSNYITGYPVATSINGSFYGSNYMFTDNNALFNNVNNTLYAYRFASGNRVFGFKVTISPYLSNLSSNRYTVRSDLSFLYRSSTSNFNIDSLYHSNIYKSYGIVLYQNDLWASSWYTISNTLRSSLYDDRFHARTFKNSYNQNMLEIKWDSSVYPNTGSFNYLKSVLQLSLKVNGNNISVFFDSEQYPDIFVSADTSYIPYMFLDSVGNIVTLQDSDSAFLTKIQLTQYAYPSSASSSSATAYTASTLYNLSLTDSVQLPIWSDPTISQQGGHIIDIATGNVYDNVSFSPPDGYSQQHLSELEQISWADVKVISQVSVTGNSQDTIDSLYKDVVYLLMQDWKHFADSSLTDFNDVAAYIQSVNQYTDTYDIIIFLWNDNGSDLCWVTYTHRYYIRLMYKQFGNFQTIMEGSAAYVADIYDYLFSRLEPLNDNLILYFDSALLNNQTILSYIQSINGFCNSIDNTLFSGFNSVIGNGGRSLSDIYNRLGDISVGGGNSGFILNDFMTAFENKMSYLFVPTYDGLEDNFDTAIDDLGILALPFSFSYELISACKVPYSYTLDITFPSMSIPWHEEMEGGSVDSNLVLWEDYDFSFNPASVIPSDWLEFFQYLNALLVLVSVTLMTYRHIFRHSEGQGGNTL